MNKDEEENYIWEAGYEKTWEVIKEDDEGLIGTSIQQLMDESRKKQRINDSLPKRLGIMRHLIIVLDMSPAMSCRDFKPMRITFVLELLKQFVDTYFQLNPIGQLGLISTGGGRAQVLRHLTSDSTQFKKAIHELTETQLDEQTGCSPSIQNSAELALRQLQYLPKHSSRELVFIMGSLSSIDPGDINETIKNLKENSVRCSIISLSAEVYLHKYIAKETNGNHVVALNEEHFFQMMNHICSPELSPNVPASLVSLAFPLQWTQDRRLSCYQEDHSTSQCNVTYICPHCRISYCSLPTVCRVCSMTLVSGTELVRSVHYLFPLPIFEEVKSNDMCQGCLTNSENLRLKCPKCAQLFCCECDKLMHTTVFSCPGCCV